MVKQNSKATAKPHRHVQATAADIVPPTLLAKPKISSKWSSHHRKLSDLRDSLLRQKGALTQDANEEQPSFSEHMADAGTDSYDRDFALSMLSAEQNALYEVEEALRRIEAGTYGKCEMTGKPIPMERLAAIPWTRFTIEAEKQLEQTGQVNRSQLAPLGSVSSGEVVEEESGERETHGRVR